MAELAIKILLCNLLLALLRLADPLCLHGGEYEADPTMQASGLPRRGGRGPAACAVDGVEVQALLRVQALRGVVLWGGLSLVALGNLVYASSRGATGTREDITLPGVVVLAVAGLFAVVTALYLSRCCGCCCGGCCGRCARRQRFSAVQPQRA